MPKFQKNKNIVKAEQYVRKNSIEENVADYIKETARIRSVIFQHISVITDDPENKNGDLTKFNATIDYLKTSFASQLPIDMQEKRNQADYAFNDIKRLFSQLVFSFKESTKEKPTPYQCPAMIDRILDNIDARILNLTDITEKLPEKNRKEAEATFKEIFEQLDTIRIKNRPKEPAKDMIGASVALETTYNVLTFPYQLLSAIKGADANMSYPQDVEGRFELQKLKKSIDSILKKNNDHIIDNNLPTANDEDMKMLISQMTEALNSVPVFYSEVPQAHVAYVVGSMNGDEQINPTLEILNENLKAACAFFKDFPGYLKLAEGSQELLEIRYRSEYDKLAKIAFDGDITVDEDAKLAWNKMKALSSKLPELDKTFEKDRYSMMLTNPNFCRNEVKAAENRLKEIQKDGFNADIRDIKHFESAEEMNRSFPHVFKKFKLYNESKMTLLFGRKAINDFNIATKNTKSKDDDIESITKEAIIDRISNKFENREALHQYVEHFSNIAKEIPGTKNTAFDNEVVNFNATIENKKEELKKEGKKEEDIKREANKFTHSYLEQVNQSFKDDAATYSKNIISDYDGSIQEAIVNAGKNRSLDWDTLKSMLPKGSDEANRLRDAIVSAKNAEHDCKYNEENTKSLINASINYLHLKSSVPFTTKGKNRVAAAGSILATVGLEYALKNDDDFSNDIMNEIKIEMMRNKTFRDKMAALSADKVNKSLLQNPDQNMEFNSGVKDLDTYTDLLVFAEQCNVVFEKEKNCGINIKIDNDNTLDVVNIFLDTLEKSSDKAKESIEVVGIKAFSTLAKKYSNQILPDETNLSIENEQNEKNVNIL